MFKAAVNPYDEIVAKATDDHQTTENWEVIISLCDKVIDEKEAGARNVIAAILKRLAHRSSNVQLYTLSLAESLEKNCTVELHREMASKAFTQGLEKLISDRNTHDKVRKRALSLIHQWAESFERDPTLGIMNECYSNLKAKGYKFEGVQETVQPPEVDDEIRRREEEELQRVLEMSKNDRGGRGHWVDYASGAGASSSAAASSSNAATAGPSSSATTTRYPGGYTPSASPALNAQTQNQPLPARTQPQRSSMHVTSSSIAAEAAAAVQRKPSQSATQRTNSYAPAVSSPIVAAAAPAPAVPATSQSPAPAPAEGAPRPASRVRALHKFEPTEPGELGFAKGDVIKVVDRGYKDWWRGQLRGRTGIFPVNYVEPIPEPTEDEIVREAQAEAAIFSQAAAIDQLLEMLKGVDPVKDNLADNEEIQELYRSCMTLRPKIVKLIDRYSQKKADLLAMNDSFVKARKVYDQVMEESLAKYNPGASLQEYGPPGGQQYGWNPALYQNGPYGPPGPQQGPPPMQYNPHSQQQQPPYDQQPQQHPGAYPQQDPSQQYVQPYGAPPPGQQQPGLDRQTSYAPSQFAPTPNPYEQQQAPPSQSPPPQMQPNPYAQQQPPPQQQAYQPMPPQQQHVPQPQQQAPPPSAAAGAFSPPPQGQGQGPFARPGTAMPEVQAQSPLWAQQQHQQPQAQPQQQQPPLTQTPQQYQPVQNQTPMQAQPPVQSQYEYAPPQAQVPGPSDAYTPTPQPQHSQHQAQPTPFAQAQVQTPQRQPSISRGPLPQPGGGGVSGQQQPGLQSHPSFSVTSATPTSPLAHTGFTQQQQQQPAEDPVRTASPPQQQQPQQQPIYAYQQPAEVVQQQQQQPAQQPEPEPQPQPQPEPTPAPAAAAAATSPPAEESNVISGPPPYPWDPTKKYADAGADAWAQYYAKGGTDPAGRVYFIPSTLPDANGSAPAQPQQTTGSPTGAQRTSSYGATNVSADPHAGSQSPVQQQQVYGGGAQRQTSSGEPNFAGRMSHQMHPGLAGAQHAQTPPHAEFMH